MEWQPGRALACKDKVLSTRGTHTKAPGIEGRMQRLVSRTATGSDREVRGNQPALQWEE